MPGVKLAHRTFRQVRSRLLGGAAILGYHRISEGPDPFGLAVSPAHFAAHLDVVANHARPMRLADAVRASAQGTLPRRAVVVTFDDGYGDTCGEALPLLERTAVPATVFVTTGSAGQPFWWDELAKMLAGALPASGLSPLAERLQALSSGDRQAAMQQLRKQVPGRRVAAEPGPTATAPEDPRALTTDEIRRLATSPCIEIGAHTVSHPMLSSLAHSAQRQEIEQSRSELEALTGRAVRSFSYPHGAYTAQTIALVAGAGFTLACGSTPDVLRARSRPFELPRLWVGNMDGDRFASWLGRWI